jgi:nitrile hydratase accessory protein
VQTRFEHFALASMMGEKDSPPRFNGRVCFASEWERQAFGIALALAKTGYFEWEDFRQLLIQTIGEWQRTHALDDPSWSYYEQWLRALERALVQAQVASPAEIDSLLSH